VQLQRLERAWKYAIIIEQTNRRIAMSAVEEIFLDVSSWKSLDKLQLVEKILTSLNPVDKKIEAVWADEVEERLEAYDKGLLTSVSAKDVFAKYQK